MRISIEHGIDGAKLAVSRNDSIIIVDAIRASTTYVNAFASGALRIVPCSSRVHLNEKFKEYPDALRSGERLCQKIEGYDLGSSPEVISWNWRDKDDNFHQGGEMTPQNFAKKFISIPYRKYISLINDLRNEYYRTYTVEYLQNMLEAEPIIFLNIPIDEMKKITQKQLENNLFVDDLHGCNIFYVIY